MDDEARARAERRRQHAEAWPVRRHALGAEPLRDPLDRSSVADRVNAMWPLAREAWAVARRPIPTYDRRAIPAVLTRRVR